MCFFHSLSVHCIQKKLIAPWNSDIQGVKAYTNLCVIKRTRHSSSQNVFSLRHTHALVTPQKLSARGIEGGPLHVTDADGPSQQFGSLWIVDCVFSALCLSRERGQVQAHNSHDSSVYSCSTNLKCKQFCAYRRASIAHTSVPYVHVQVYYRGLIPIGITP